MLRFTRGPRKGDPRLQGVRTSLHKYHQSEVNLEQAMTDGINTLEVFLSYAPHNPLRSSAWRMPSFSLAPVARAFGRLFGVLAAPAAAAANRRPAMARAQRRGITPPGMRNASLRALSLGVMGVAGIAAASTAGVGVATLMPGAKHNAALVLQNADCAEAHALKDSQGYAGHLPTTSCTSDIVHTAGFDDPTAMLVTETYAAIEGGVFADETLYGQDLKGIARWAVAKVPFALQAAKHLGMPFTSGGSSGWQTAVEAFHGSPHALSAWQKPEMVVMGIRLAATEYADDLDRARFVSRLATIAGYGGTPIGGAHGALVLFGGAPKDLFELCLQASAMGKPFLLTTGAPLPDAYKARNTRVLNRARDCIRKSAKDEAERASELARLEAWKIPHMPEVSTLDAAIKRTLRQETRLAQVAGKGRIIELTTNRVAQAQALAAGDMKTASGALAPIRAKLPANACFIKGDCDQPVGVAFVAAEIVGDRFLTRAVRSNMSGAIYGPVRSQDGQYLRQMPAMGEASIAKMAHIIVAADQRVQSLCSKSWGSIQDFDGFAGVADCDEAFGTPERRSVSDAIAWSANLGFIEFASQYQPEMQRVFKHLGWMGEPTPQATIEAALGLGVMPSPADVMQTLGAIEVGKLHPLGMLTNQPRPEGNGKLVDLHAFGLDEQELNRARHWMSKPVTAGTLTSTVSRMRLPQGCQVRLGKTGTTFDDPRRLSKNLVLSVQCGARKFVLYGGVWTLNQATGSVGRLKHKDLAPMLSAILAAGLQT